MDFWLLNSYIWRIVDYNFTCFLTDFQIKKAYEKFLIPTAWLVQVQTAPVACPNINMTEWHHYPSYKDQTLQATNCYCSPFFKCIDTNRDVTGGIVSTLLIPN